MNYLEYGLSFTLNYLTYVHPVIHGAKLCQQSDPDSSQVSNATLTLIFAWGMEFIDTIFLSSFIAMRNLYTFVRIILLLYFVHPKFLGALTVYDRLFASLVDRYFPLVDSLVLQHVERIREWGVIQYSSSVGMSILRAGIDVVDIAQRLIASSSDSNVKPARLVRRLSQEREEEEENEERAVQYVVEAMERDTQQRSMDTPPPRAPPSPLPVSSVGSSTFATTTADPLDIEFEEEFTAEGDTDLGTTPPAAVRRERVTPVKMPERRFSRNSSHSSFQM